MNILTVHTYRLSQKFFRIRNKFNLFPYKCTNFNAFYQKNESRKMFARHFQLDFQILLIKSKYNV